MKVAIAISSVLSLYIAAPVNAHVSSGANGAMSTSVPSTRPEERQHDGVCAGPVNRATEKREVEKLTLQGAGEGGVLSHVSSISTKASRVLGEMETIDLGRPDADESGGRSHERGERSGARGSGSGASSSASPDVAVTRQASEILDAGDAITESESALGRGAGSGALDLGPDLVGATKYGEGFAGALGVPEFSYLGELAPGSTIQLFVENSSGVDCFGYLLVGHRETHVTLRSGAVLLCSTDILIARVKLFPGNNQVQYTIPRDAEGAIYMQVTQQDEAALGGWSMSKGLKLIL